MANSPTESYKRLYDAVKAHDLETIKALITKKTLEWVGIAAKSAGKSTDDMLIAGCTETTYAETLPTMRDERLNGNMGALEVWNGRRGQWEDLPYILEDGVWKLALGDANSRSYRSPGPGRAVRESQASNALSTSTPSAGSAANRTPIAENTPPTSNRP